MKKTILALGLSCITSAPLPAANPTVRFDTALYVFNDTDAACSVVGSTLAVTKNRWMVFGAPIQLKIGEESVTLQGSRLVRTSDGAMPPELNLVSVPVIVNALGRSAEVQVSSPAEYFEMTPDRVFRHRRIEDGSPEAPHYSLTLTAHQDAGPLSDYQIDCAVDLAQISDREKISGVDLPVGKPILTKFHDALSFTAQPGRWFCLLKPEHTGAGIYPIILLRVMPEVASQKAP